MESENKYLVSLVRKHSIYENKKDVYLYTYVSTLVGKNSIDEKYFIDEEGSKYPNIDNWEELLKEDYSYACIGQISLQEMAERAHMPVSNNLENICNAYHEDAKNYCYLAFMNQKEDKRLIALDIEKLKQNARYIKHVDNNQLIEDNCDIDEIQSIYSHKKNDYVDNLGMIKVSKLLPKLIGEMPSQKESIKKLLVEINNNQLAQDIKRDSILLFGLNNSTKRNILKEICFYINRPLLVIETQKNSNNFERYIGELLLHLHNNWKGDIKKIENSIVFFENMDKPSKNKEKVLKVIQKFIDGENYYISENFKISTDKMINILDFSIPKRKQIGFTNKEEYIEELKNLKKNILKFDFIKKMPILITLNDLQPIDFKTQLKLSPLSPMNIKKENFQKLGTNLVFTEGVYNTLAQSIYDKKIDQREISNIISELTYPSFAYILENRKKVEEIKIDKNTLEDNNKYKIKYKK